MCALGNSKQVYIMCIVQVCVGELTLLYKNLVFARCDDAAEAGLSFGATEAGAGLQASGVAAEAGAGLGGGGGGGLGSFRLTNGCAYGAPIVLTRPDPCLG